MGYTNIVESLLMLENASLQPKKSAPTRLYLALGAGLVVMGGLLFIAVRHQPGEKSSTSASTPRSILASIPLSYTDFTGKITAIDGQQINILFSGYDDAGQVYEKNYTAQITSATDLLQTQSGAPAQEAAPITYDQFRAGDTVMVVGNDNLADITNFTATKLIRY